MGTVTSDVKVDGKSIARLDEPKFFGLPIIL